MLMGKELKTNKDPCSQWQGRAPLSSLTLSQQAIPYFTNLKKMERRVNFSTLTGNQTQLSYMLCKHASHQTTEH